MDNQFDLSEKHCKSLLKLANAKKHDIFYDLGSGKGRVVYEAIKQKNVKLSIGIESDIEYYEYARNYSIDRLTKKQLKKIQFHLGRLDNEDSVDGKLIFDYSDANIVYYSLDEEKSDLKFFRKRFGKNTKLIKKDIPLVGYSSISNYDNKDCYFFMSKMPFKKIIKTEWIKSIDRTFESINQVYDYYFDQLYNRFKKIGDSDNIAKKNSIESLLNLKILVNRRF